MTLGEFIQKYRAEHELSYRAFGALTGLSTSYVIILETGINNDGKPVSPTMATYKKIASGLGMSEMELLSVVDDNVTVNPVITDDQRELLTLIQQLRPDQTDALLTLARQLADRGKSQDGQE